MYKYYKLNPKCEIYFSNRFPSENVGIMDYIGQRLTDIFLRVCRFSCLYAFYLKIFFKFIKRTDISDSLLHGLALESFSRYLLHWPG